ncbi:MAG: hypothetical protein EA351_11385 [Gemmatimonadales bacterium]|nr:MAG: hypothetical protein EA351_11385 [Gemmatimonadales bacterium]
MIFLALAIVCSTAIAVIFKLTEGRYDRMALVTVNYAAAVGTASVVLAFDPPGRGLAAEPPLLLLGGGLGVLFVAGFVLFSRAIGVAGISLATATMRLSVAIPFLASWLVWGEVPTVGQALGLGVAATAFLLISRPTPAPPLPSASAPSPPRSPGLEAPTRPLLAFILLALLFLAGGLVDTTLKVFEEEFAAENSRALFLLVVFTVAFVVGSTVVVIRGLRSGRWPSTNVIGWGVLLGLVNYGSAEFMLLALGHIPGTVAFPVNNVAVVALATLLGMSLWREAFGAVHRVGLVLALAALVLFGF